MTDPLPRPDPFRLGGTVLDGRFHVAREVAEGGFGVVYYAIQVALDRPVALKVLKTPLGMDQAARAHFHDKFATEAKTIARIRHPNIVDVYDFGISKMPSGQLAPWMALEWIHGRTLDDFLTARRGQGGQSPSDVLAMLRPVLRAFAYAHRDGIAHRDIKPANIMVVPSGSAGTTTETGTLLRILDFGIAKVMNNDEHPGSGLTRTEGMPAFSPQYAAPEQFAFGRTGPWTDVHALGLLLTEMLVDALPYQAKDVQLFEEAMSAKRPTPGAKGRNVGPWEGVLAKALALSPTERWKSAAELLAALEATVGAATAASSAGSRGQGRFPLGQTLPLTAESAASFGQIATELQAEARQDPDVPAAKPASAVSSRSGASVGDSSKSTVGAGVPRRWSRSKLGGAAALVVGVLIVLGFSLTRGGSAPPSGPSMGDPPQAAKPIQVKGDPVSPGTEGPRPALGPIGSDTPQATPKTTATDTSTSAFPIKGPLPPAVLPTHPAGIVRTKGNPRGPTHRSPEPANAGERVTHQKSADSAAKSIERLPIE